MEQVLGRVRPGVLADQDRRLAGVQHELLRPRRVLGVGGVEVADRGAVVRPVDPAVPRPELEPGEGGVGLDRVERAEQLGGVDAVADRLGDGAHESPPWWSWSFDEPVVTREQRRGWPRGGTRVKRR